MKTILGIDPGSIVTGYGIILQDEKKISHIISGCIKTKNFLMYDKLKIIYSRIYEIIEKFKPSLLAIEDVFISYKRSNSIIKLSQARGVAILAAANKNIQVFEYANKLIKYLISGNGSTSKKEGNIIVKKILKLNFNLQQDESDALAVAIAHVFYKK